MDGKPGGELGDTELIHGIVIDKEFSHAQVSLSNSVGNVWSGKLCGRAWGRLAHGRNLYAEYLSTLTRGLLPRYDFDPLMPPRCRRAMKTQMPKNVNDAKLCLLTCPFEPPKPKTKHKLDITSRDAYEKLFEREQKYFADMVQQCKDVGTNLVRLACSYSTAQNEGEVQTRMDTQIFTQVSEIGRGTGESSEMTAINSHVA